jgi:hypothetical protein
MRSILVCGARIGVANCGRMDTMLVLQASISPLTWSSDTSNIGNGKALVRIGCSEQLTSPCAVKAPPLAAGMIYCAAYAGLVSAADQR